MNDVLGGGGFTSRLVNRIRSDEGLAYQVGTRLNEGVYYPEPWRLVFQSKVRSVAYALQIAQEEITKMRDTPITQEELETSKNGFIEAFPTIFATASAIAGQLAADELTGRYPKHANYWMEYRSKIDAVHARRRAAGCEADARSVQDVGPDGRRLEGHAAGRSQARGRSDRDVCRGHAQASPVARSHDHEAHRRP
jgi:predicted Zn-dependent peptidase